MATTLLVRLNPALQTPALYGHHINMDTFYGPLSVGIQRV